MYRLLLIALLCSCSLVLHAQKRQGLSLTIHEDKWMVKHRAAQGETVFLLSRRYHVPPAMIADANDNAGYDAMLPKDSVIYIPLGTFNYLAQPPASAGEAKAIWYKVRDEDNLGRISRRTGVSQRIIQDLNNMPDNNVEPGQVLQIGWVRYDATQMLSSNDGAIKSMEKVQPVAVKDTVKPVARQVDSNSRYKIVLVRKEVKQPNGKIDVYLLRDTVWADTLGPGGKVYMTQTQNEQNIAEEKGTVVFYDMPGKVKSTKAFFALHNTLPKGTAVRVYNPGTDKYVFVKVIGPMPDTKQYHNAILGIGSGARAVLGVSVTEEKAWCELKYAAQ